MDMTRYSIIQFFEYVLKTYENNIHSSFKDLKDEKIHIGICYFIEECEFITRSQCEYFLKVFTLFSSRYLVIGFEFLCETPLECKRLQIYKYYDLMLYRILFLRRFIRYLKQNGYE